jgi:fumarylacetoacetate (FAA) hydrolase
VRVGEVIDGCVRELEASSMIAWLSGDGRRPTGREDASEDVQLLAPVPSPPSYRDFMTSDGHARRASRALLRDPTLELSEHWYSAPAFYFGNHHAITGPDAPVVRPEGVRMLDFELEIAAVLDATGAIAGFTLLNDWSARDLQRLEATVGLGVHKSKDFATSLGPWLVTPDELPYEDGVLSVRGFVAVDGENVVETDTSEQRFTWPDMVAHAARNTRLQAGDVLASGTLPWGCLIEIGPLDGERWVQPGSTVTLGADGLGELTNRVLDGE